MKDVPVTFIPDTAIEVNIALQKLATHAIGGTLVDSVTLEPVHALVELFVKRSVGDTVLTDSTDPGGAFQFPQQYLSAPPVNSYDRLVFDVPPPYAGAVISPVTLAGADLSYQVQLKHADVFLIAASDSGKYLSYYQTALDAVHATFNTWDLARKGPAPLGLAPSFGLRTVIAYTGDLAAPLPGGLADSLVACLDAGGHLFLTGQNVAEYNAASALFTSYLGVGFAGNTPLAYCQGFAGESLQGFNFFTTGSGANNQMSRDSLHALRPDVHPILEYGVNTGRVAGVRVDSAGAGNAIVLGFGFEAIHTAAKRQALLQYVFDWSVATAVTSGEEPFLPASAFLEQNYPNPFNPNTTIRFRVPAAAHATLRVYDLNGREVAALLDRRVEPGAHSVVWSAAGFASGVYYCRLTVSDGGNGAAPFTETRKLLLLQ